MKFRVKLFPVPALSYSQLVPFVFPLLHCCEWIAFTAMVNRPSSAAHPEQNTQQSRGASVSLYRILILHVILFQRAFRIFSILYNGNCSLSFLFFQKIKSPQSSASTRSLTADRPDHQWMWAQRREGAPKGSSSRAECTISVYPLNEAAVITQMWDGPRWSARWLEKRSASLWCCQRLSPQCSEQRASSSEGRRTLPSVVLRMSGNC